MVTLLQKLENDYSNEHDFVKVSEKLSKDFLRTREVGEFLSGALSRAMTKAVLAPLETINFYSSKEIFLRELISNASDKASKLIAKRSTPMDGQLFLIKHLLILREQIAPFNIEFSVTHKELDFSHLLENLRRILRGQTSLFDWSGSTSLARTLSPRVLESQVDAKKELEKSLKATCEEFIMVVTKQVVDPMLAK